MSRNVFAEVDAWKARVVEEDRKARAVTGWRAIVDLPVPTTAPVREWEKNKLRPLNWRRLEVRFRVHHNDARVWVMRPRQVPEKWNSLGKYELGDLPEALLLIFGWRKTSQPLAGGIGFGKEWPPGVLERARSFVEALMVERDAWLGNGGAVRHTMRPFRWEDFG